MLSPIVVALLLGISLLYMQELAVRYLFVALEMLANPIMTLPSLSPLYNLDFAARAGVEGHG